MLPQWKDAKDNVVASLEDVPEGAIGFIYLLKYTDGTYYIGKKDLYKKATLPSLKSGEQRPNSTRVGRNVSGKRMYFDIVTKESDWLTYKSSCKEVQNLEIEERFILTFAYSKRELTYLEVKYLFVYVVLEDEYNIYHNANILNKFFKGNIKW